MQLPSLDRGFRIEVLHVIDKGNTPGTSDDGGGDAGEERAVGAEDDVEGAAREKACYGGHGIKRKITQQSADHILLRAGGVDIEAQDIHSLVLAALGQLASVLIPHTKLFIMGERGYDGDIVSAGHQTFADPGHQEPC